MVANNQLLLSLFHIFTVSSIVWSGQYLTIKRRTNKMTFSQNLRIKVKVAVIALFLSQVSSQINGPGGGTTPSPSGGSSPSSAISPKYEQIGKYEVASPDSVS